MASLDLLEDACAAIPHHTRAMFGGHGVFARHGGMFAGIVDDDRIILKLEPEEIRAELVAQGGAPWVYKSKAKSMTMAAWILVPDALYDDPRALAAWASRAHAVARPRSTTKKASAKKGGVSKSARKRAK